MHYQGKDGGRPSWSTLPKNYQFPLLKASFNHTSAPKTSTFRKSGARFPPKSCVVSHFLEIFFCTANLDETLHKQVHARGSGGGVRSGSTPPSYAMKEARLT